MDYGLIGEKLSHSYSKPIHALIGDYDYKIQNLAPEELEGFLKAADFKGINVTIPYKKAVMPFCHSLSETAERLGNVNTIVKRKDGSLHGDNTDYYGFAYMVSRAGLSFENEDVLIIGTGGAALTAETVALDGAAAKVTKLSRKGPVNYENVYDLCGGAGLIINASPVGMYPDTEKTPLELEKFKNLKGVLDLIYNPLYSRLIQEAEAPGIKRANGLSMLAAQAMQAAELFMGGPFKSKFSLENIIEKLTKETANIVLVGMPGSGKTTIGRELAALCGKSFVDTDNLIEKESGQRISSIFDRRGEEYFRDLEAQIIKRVGKEKSQIISTGGGAVLRTENIKNLKQNALIVYVNRDLEDLATNGRPLSASRESLEKLYVTRLPIYKSVSDVIIKNDKHPYDVACRILDLFEAHRF